MAAVCRAGTGGEAGIVSDHALNNVGGASASGPVTLITDALDFPLGAIRSSGTLTIKSRTPSTSVGVGGGAGTLNINDTELAVLADGFSSITIGDATGGTGAVDVDSSTFSDPVNIVGGGLAMRIAARQVAVTRARRPARAGRTAGLPASVMAEPRPGYPAGHLIWERGYPIWNVAGHHG